MNVGDVVNWLDQGPAILLERCDIPMPCLEGELGDFMADPEAWPTDVGWKIKLLTTGEILDVHEETINSNFRFRPVGIH